MKAKKFKLEALLSYRHFLKTQAAGRLAQAAKERLEAYESLAKCESILAEMEKMLDPRFAPSARASDLLLIQKGIAEQRRQIAEATSAYNEALQHEQDSHDQVVIAQKDYEAILKLESKHKEAAWAESLKAEEQALNEYTTARFKRAVEA